MTESQNLNLCLQCRRRLRTCVCELIRPFETNSRIVILMHPMEYKKEKVGTGRFTHMILKNSKVIVDINFDENAEFLKLLNDTEYESYLLYPGEAAIDLGTEDLSKTLRKKAQFFVIDGTWPCAKKMMKLTSSLHHLPRVSFLQKGESQFLIKHQPLPSCLSTVESVDRLLSDLERMAIEDQIQGRENLLEVFYYTVKKQIQLSQDDSLNSYRKKSFTEPQRREISKKWKTRSLIFVSKKD